MEHVLKIENLCFTYHTLQGETEVLKDISFDLKEGEFVAVIGPSGCGKSTLFSLIANLYQPTSGNIVVRRQNEGSASPIGYMLQKDYLLEWRTIYDNTLLGLEINHLLNEVSIHRVEELLKLYGLWEFRNKKPNQLSGGMKQRAALIRTLALNPDLLLLDEPFSALDYQTRITVSSDICNLIRGTNKTVLLITHDLSEAISLADRILVFSKRPASIIRDFKVQLTRSDDTILASRNAPEFKEYFHMLWEDLNEGENKN